MESFQMMMRAMRGKSWFARLMGFEEENYFEAREQMEVIGDGTILRSLANNRTFGCGVLELVCFSDLAKKMKNEKKEGKLKLSSVIGDVKKLHNAENAGALFQVASQFNMLEMVAPRVTPLDGVAGYEYDRTQGPACAIACGAATIYRNYFCYEGKTGQTEEHQLNGFKEVEEELKRATKHKDILEMRNGYALFSEEGIKRVAKAMNEMSEEQLKDLMENKLKVGLHSNVQVTHHLPEEEDGSEPIFVSQIFCSALPVSYCYGAPRSAFKEIATLVLTGAYKCTLAAAVLNPKSNVCFLTALGGGVFGNEDEWIEQAMRIALNDFADFDLDVRIVSYGRSERWIRDLVEEYT